MAIVTKTKPISLFFQSLDQPIHRIFYCPFCQYRLFDMNGALVAVVDNSGANETDFYTELKCRNSNCQQVWRIYGPPPTVDFEPVVRVNGVRI